MDSCVVALPVRLRAKLQAGLQIEISLSIARRTLRIALPTLVGGADVARHAMGKAERSMTPRVILLQICPVLPVAVLNMD